MGGRASASDSAIWLGNIGATESKLGKFKTGEKYLLQSLELSESINDFEGIKETNQNLSVLYDTLGKITANPALAKNYFQQSLEHYRKFIEARDSIVNAENIRSQTRAEMNYEFEMKEMTMKEKQKLDDERNRRQRMISWFAVGGLVLVSVFSVLLLKRFRITSRQKKIIEQQKKIVEEKNKDITDSISYAKKIQEAIFTEKEVKYRLFPDAFVLLLPRDIVSGDFYWFAEKNGRRLIASVDCTGHGVPGAFMSMIGNYFLQEAVNEKGIVRPDLILGELRHLVIDSLKQKGEEGETRDGMDVALLSFDDAANTVEYAGANNPLWLIRNGELTEYEPDKRPIGYFSGLDLPFTNHKIKLRRGDVLYIFTDGYADQFGGAEGKKFKYRQFEELLLSVHGRPMPEQEKILTERFNEWKGPLEQVDDVCVIGIRV
jgi:serine phosphatase RsbU (regulator of sigma subunit)